MRIALISDIHGNLVALDAVLDDIESQRPEGLVCLGDVAVFGPQPHEVSQRLMRLDCPVVMGNTDEWLLNPGLPEQPDDQEARHHEEIAFWCLDQLLPTDLEFLRTFRPTIEISLEPDMSLLCFHGSPKSNRDVIVATTPDDQLEQLFSGYDMALLAGGHTHEQLLRRYRGQTIINPGSVGLPIERLPAADRNPPWAEYALISWQAGLLAIELRRVPIDVDEIVGAALRSGMPHAQWWSADWD
jgi:putative phosphoesterase